MTNEELVAKFYVNGRIVPKRCTDEYLKKIGMFDKIMESSKILPLSASLKERIFFIKEGLTSRPVCKTCSGEVKFRDRYPLYCSMKCVANDPDVILKKQKTGEKRYGVDSKCSKKNLSYDFLFDLYINQKKSIIEISRILGNVSNVTVKKRLKEFKIPIRSHSENQSLTSGSKGKPAFNSRIDIDRPSLAREYSEYRIPIKSLAEKYHCDPETIRRFLSTEGVERFHRRSDIEYKIASFLDQNGLPYKSNDMKILDGLQIDFLLSDFNLGIETHGTYYHSQYPKNYHWEKFNLANKKNIKLLQFWDVDLYNRFSIIKSMILNHCGKNQWTVGARKCSIVYITYNASSEFYEENHIQGKTSKNTTTIGLEYNNEIKAALSYVLTKDVIFITRFANKLNGSVQGGFSKLLSFVRNQHLTNKIITYSHNDISQGNLYKNCGFIFSRESPADLWYTNFNEHFNRQKFMKNKIKHFENYSDDKTEMQILYEVGIVPIFKSGTRTWVLNPDQ